MKTYPDVIRLMLGTSVHFSKINFDNCIKNGFPVDNQFNAGYDYLEITDIDEDGYPSGSSYIDAIGNTCAWGIWNRGRWRWSKLPRIKVDGRWRRNMGADFPVSGGYGIDKHTLVCEFPPYLIHTAKVIREKATKAKEKADREETRLAKATAERNAFSEAARVRSTASRRTEK